MLNQLKKPTAASQTQKIDNSSLFTAVEKNDIQTVKSLIIEKEVDVNIYNQDGFTPLHIAVAREYSEMTKILLAAQANPNAQGEEGNTPLHFAAEGNNLKILKCLVKNKYGNQKGDVNAVNKYGWSVLHSAASGIIKVKEDWEIMKWLLQQEALNTEVETDGKDEFERWSISNVFWQKDYYYAKIYEELVKKYKSSSEIHFNQQVKLWIQEVKEKKQPLMEKESGKCVREINLYSDESSLSIESEEGETSEQNLLNGGIPVNIVTQNNRSVSGVFFSKETYEKIKEEWEKKQKEARIQDLGSPQKVEVEAISEEEKEKLFEAVENGNIELVEKTIVVIRERGININSVRDDSGNTLMHIAAEENNLEMLKLLVEKEGNIDAKNKYDLSVLHSVASGIVNKRENWDIMEWILQRKGLKIDVKTKGGLTVRNIFMAKSEHLADHYEDLLDRLFQEGKIEQEPKF